MAIRIKKYTDLNKDEVMTLHNFLRNNEERASPYHTTGFANVVKDVFGYNNLSLVAFDSQDRILGYLPQWGKGQIIESVPWRDRGGPICEDEDVLRYFIEETRNMVKNLKFKGFVWRAFQTDLLENYKYFVNIIIDLTKYNATTYWNDISLKVKGKIRSAERHGLIFRVESEDIQQKIENFFKLFIFNRKRLGVPTYPIKLFQSYFGNIPDDQIKIFNIYKNGIAISSLILLHNAHTAIDAYSASSKTALKLKANDFMVWNVINYCMSNGIKRFEFGADSPLQRSLIDYKLKWLGEEKKVVTSFWGDIKETDHNKLRYGLIKRSIKMMPRPIYLLFSNMIVR